MKIQMIGLGIVGTAQAYLSQKLGHEVVGYDIQVKTNEYCKVNDDYIDDADITFICTPEAVVEDIVEKLVKIEHRGIIVIKSTVPIRTTEQLSKKFNVHICHNPEFLRERHYLHDVINPNMIVIGQCCEYHGSVLESFYQHMGKPIIRVDTNTSELSKLSLNSYLSTLITFWNQIDQLCCKLGIDTMVVADMIKHDPRVSCYGRDFFGVPYGGRCLPKDIKHIIDGFRSHGLDPKLFEERENFNQWLSRKLESGKR